MADITVPLVNFSALGDLGTSFYQGQQMALEQAKRNALANLPKDDQGNIDFNKAAAMVAPYDPQSAATLANLGNQQQIRQQSAQEFALKQRMASPEYLAATEGAKEKARLQAQYDIAGGGNPALAGTTAGPPKPLDVGNANLTNRMLAADAALQGPHPTTLQTAAGGLIEKYPILKNLPGVTDQHFSAYNNATNDFINAVNKKPLGTRIDDKAYQAAIDQFIPTTTDTAEDIARKAENRRAAINETMASAGTPYRPPAGYDRTAGRVVPGGPTGTQVAQSQQITPLKSDAEKNAAIAEFRTAAARFIAAGQPVPQAMFAKAQALGIPASALRYGSQ